MKRTLTTTAALAALAWLLPSTTASAQEETTIEEALEALQRKKDPHLPAVAILRQASGPRPEAELDAFADRLAGMVADTTLPRQPGGVRWNAAGALMIAAIPKAGVGYEGTPYLRAFDLLVQVYEGGADDVLRTIRLADPERGPAYVREVFERSERPTLCPVMPGSMGLRPGDTIWAVDGSEPLGVWDPPPECVRGSRTFHKTTWCKAGWVLYEKIVGDASDRMW
ncbi:MAG: hypothetical protein J4F34_08735, partial [Gemmatimonadetes bacterium]|nr:hypothetical protein [Gemmatimonadota bacterium]